MKVTRQRYFLIALAVALTLSAWTAWRDTANGGAEIEMTISSFRSEQSERRNTVPGQSRSAGAQTKTMDAALPARDPLIDAEVDPFDGQNFLNAIPAAPAPVAVSAPIPPAPAPRVAPPFPYQYFGSMVEVDGTSRIYLTRQGNIIPVETENILDNDYRVDAISATQIRMTYLPLNEIRLIQIISSEQKDQFNKPTRQ